MPPKWTPIVAAYHLGEAYAAEQGEDADYSPYEVELIARAMDADPEYLEEVWGLGRKNYCWPCTPRRHWRRRGTGLMWC